MTVKYLDCSRRANKGAASWLNTSLDFVRAIPKHELIVIKQFRLLFVSIVKKCI